MSRFPTGIVVTHAYICLSMRSTAPRSAASAPMECSPTTDPLRGPSGASVVRLTPDYYPRTAARLVSCYALFE